MLIVLVYRRDALAGCSCQIVACCSDKSLEYLFFLIVNVLFDPRYRVHILTLATALEFHNHW